MTMTVGTSGLITLLILALGQSVSVHASSYPTEVLELTDNNFEHDTQAASGQTTGAWAVLFYDSAVKRHERANLVVEHLAKNEDKEAIYARVDVATNQKLARRFGHLLLLPCVLLFRDRQMYLFDRSFEGEDAPLELRDFVNSGFAVASPLDVPPPRDLKLNVEAFQESTEMDHRVVFWAVVMILGGLLFQTWAIINKHKFRQEAEDRLTSLASKKSGVLGSKSSIAKRLKKSVSARL